ncbi:MAG: alpha/beta hydrolase [Chloroflexota bacterium]|nr:alpha/beta hydrolase [Chloroflexota bacterium]
MKQLSETRYARTPDGVDLAYRTVGDGPVDLFWSFNQLNDVEFISEHRPILEYFDGLADFARVIVHDRRGMGRSGGERGDLETDVADVVRLFDAVGAKRPYLASAVAGGAIYVACAATHPDRVAGVVWHGAFAQSIQTETYPWGATADELEGYARRTEEEWGTLPFAQRFVANGAPSVADDAQIVQFYAEWMRRTGSAQVAAAYNRAWSKIDLHPLLASVRVPVLVLDRAADPEEGAYVAALLPQGRFRRLEGDDFIPYYNGGQIVAAIREFVEDTSRSQKGMA